MTWQVSVWVWKRLYVCGVGERELERKSVRLVYVRERGVV